MPKTGVNTELPTLSLTAAERQLSTDVFKALRDIRYGSVQLVIHDGKVVEIQKIERIRPDSRCQS